MDLRHLRYFVAVAEEGTLTRAAERLGIQQPPLGQQIRALETALRVDLFDRMPKRIVLNAAGQVFLRDSRRVLAMVDEMVEHIRRFDRGEEGSVAVGFTSSASLHPLAPRMIRAFRAAYPRAQLDVQERETYELLDGVAEGRLDVAFIRVDSQGYAGLESHVLAREPLLVALPADDPLAQDDGPLPLSALDGARMIRFPRLTDGPGFFDGIVATMARSGIAVQEVDAVQRILSALNLVAAGRGATVVPAALRVMHPAAIVYRPLAGDAVAPLPLFAVHRRDLDLRIARNFLAVARHTAEADAADPGKGAPAGGTPPN